MNEANSFNFIFHVLNSKAVYDQNRWRNFDPFENPLSDIFRCFQNHYSCLQLLISHLQVEEHWLHFLLPSSCFFRLKPLLRLSNLELACCLDLVQNFRRIFVCFNYQFYRQMAICAIAYILDHLHLQNYLNFSYERFDCESLSHQCKLTGHLWMHDDTFYYLTNLKKNLQPHDGFELRSYYALKV